MEFKDKEWYLINGVPCQYDKGIFFWESEDGTKFFRMENLVGKDVDIEPMNK